MVRPVQLACLYSTGSPLAFLACDHPQSYCLRNDTTLFHAWDSRYNLSTAPKQGRCSCRATTTYTLRASLIHRTHIRIGLAETGCSTPNSSHLLGTLRDSTLTGLLSSSVQGLLSVHRQRTPSLSTRAEFRTYFEYVCSGEFKSQSFANDESTSVEIIFAVDTSCHSEQGEGGIGRCSRVAREGQGKAHTRRRA